MPVANKELTVDEKALINKNRYAFESAGYKVITVPSEATDFNDGIHCLINVIE